MNGSPNPLLPAPYDFAWTGMVLLVFALAVMALISLARSARRLSSNQALVWILVVLFVPVLGPLSWLAVGARAGSTPASARAPGSARD